jgi:hypothetical protein
MRRVWWCTPVISATWKVETGGSRVQGQPWQTLPDLISETKYREEKGWGCGSRGSTHSIDFNTAQQKHKQQNEGRTMFPLYTGALGSVSSPPRST